MPEMHARCLRCRGEFTEEQIAGANACPGCGSKGVPADPARDVTIETNWHELRVLLIWAEQWAARCEESDPEGDASGLVYAIARAFEAQHPTLADKRALTLSGEMAQLKEKYPKMEVHGDIQPGNKPPRVQ